MVTWFHKKSQSNLFRKSLIFCLALALCDLRYEWYIRNTGARMLYNDYPSDKITHRIHDQ